MMMLNESGSPTMIVDLNDPTRKYYYSIHFVLFVVVIIVNIPSSIFVLYDFLSQKHRRQDLNNHMNIILTIINIFYHLTNTFFHAYYFHTFQRLSSTRAFRYFWAYVDWLVFYLQFMLFAWATIERHILIFHTSLLATKTSRFFYHYLPPILITLYCTIYYIMVISGSGCENLIPDDPAPSFYPCALIQSNALYLYDTIAHQTVCIYVIVISSLVLFLRVIRQKYRMQQRIRWRQHRRMAFHLLSVFFFHLVFPTPFSIIMTLYLFGMSPTPITDFFVYYSFLTYYILGFYPFMFFPSCPTFSKILRKFRQKNPTVRPLARSNTAALGARVPLS